MKSLQEDIKNQDFKKVYLLCGEEDYLKKQYKEKLKNDNYYNLFHLIWQYSMDFLLILL